MKVEASWSEIYQQFDLAHASSGALSIHQSTPDKDRLWDSFLFSSPYGHFYQTSTWAQVRKQEGWYPLINLITHENKIVGGFQILWRSKPYLGKIGILFKGPVVSSNDPAIRSFAVQKIMETVKQQGIRALIIQPPDRDEAMERLFAASGFSNNYLNSAVKNNTVCIDLQGSEEEVFKRIKRQKRQNINTARKNGVVVCQGTKDDLETFFSFMTKTCSRHLVKPSPSNINFLSELWDLLNPLDRMKLFIARHNGNDISGLIVLTSGETAYLWKFGWSGEDGQVRPNEILFWEIIKWARDQGYRYADIGAVNTSFAKARLLNQTPVQQDTETEEYRFKTEFGGEIVPLSSGFAYIPNPVIKWAYNLLMPYINSKPALKNKILFSND